MPPDASVTFLVLTALVLLAMIGGIAGIVIEEQRDPSPAPWRNPAIRDAIFAVAGWGTLFALDISVTLIGEQRLPVTFKHLLGTLAVLVFYYAVLATLRLIYRSARRIHARLRSLDQQPRFRPLPILGQLAFPTLFVSAVLAAATCSPTSSAARPVRALPVRISLGPYPWLRGGPALCSSASQLLRHGQTSRARA